MPYDRGSDDPGAWTSEDYGKVQPIELHPKIGELDKPKGLRIVEECESIGEPYFVVRAKDVLGVMILVEYQRLIDTYRPSNHHMGAAISNIRTDFVQWMDAHPGEVHLPD